MYRKFILSVCLILFGAFSGVCFGADDIIIKIRADDSASIRALIEHGGDVNAKFGDNFTLLHFATYFRDIDLVKFLVERGADVNAPNDNGATPLNYAMLAYNEEFAKWATKYETVIIFMILLIGFGVVSAFLFVLKMIPVLIGWKSLRFVAEKGYLNRAKKLIERGADVNEKDNNGYQILHYAVLSDNPKMIELLVDHGADVNAKANNGWTVLHSAVLNGNVEAIHAKTRVIFTTTPVIKGEGIYLKGNLEVVQWLVEHGADVNAKDNDGCTVLHSAVENGNLDVINYLVKHGADINAKDYYGRSILHYTASRVKMNNLLLYTSLGFGLAKPLKQHEELIQWLVDRGQDINAKDNYGMTILHYACEYGITKLADWLIEQGAK